MKIESILFDLDGTLWEASSTTLRTANEVLEKYPDLEKVTIEQVNQGMGKTFEECAKIYIPIENIEKRESIMNEILDLNNTNLMKYGGTVYPSLKETLAILKEKYDLYIVSNCCDGYIETFLDFSGLNDCFKGFIPAGKYGIKKSDGIKKIINDYKIQNPIYVGDTYKDFEASKEAGIEFIQALYGFGYNLMTKYYINEIKELPNLIDFINHIEGYKEQ